MSDYHAGREPTAVGSRAKREPSGPAHERAAESLAGDAALLGTVGPSALAQAPLLLSLHRSAGNQAVLRLLSSQGPRSAVLQRSPESEKIMADIAVPQTLQLTGPEVNVQDDLVAKLNLEIDQAVKDAGSASEKLKQQWDELNKKKPPDEDTQNEMGRLQKEWNLLDRQARNFENVTHIGSIVLTEPIGSSKVEDVYSKSKLVDLPPVEDKGAGLKHSLQFSTFNLVQKAGLEKLVILNTLTAMDKAKQLAYLHEAGLPNEKFAIVVEVHYYRSRGVGETKIHKDTRGETLFVNLSFPNKRKMLGPEYIINPASTAIYDQFVRNNLPEVFVDDLNAVKKSLKGQKYIHASVLPENGIVAFVDEAIHHKTPTPEHRTATAERMPKILEAIYGDEYRDAAKAFKDYKAAVALFRGWWVNYLTNENAKKHADEWWEILDGIEKRKMTGDQPLDRTQLTAWLPAYFKSQADLIIDQAATDFTSVGFSHVDKGKIVTVPVREREDKPFPRRMSIEDLSQYKATASEGGKRSFFRTWVRSVPRNAL